MSVLIDRNATFLGVPLVTVRNALKAWRYGKSEDSHEIAVRKDVNLDPRTVMILLDELRDRGLIGAENAEGPKFDGLTEKGMALIGAKATKRVTKLKAWTILTDFLKACADANARDDLPFDVEKVWLFGSLIDDEKTGVADIDIVPVFGYPARYSFEARRARFTKLAEQLGGQDILRNAGVFELIHAESFVIRQLLYGGRRHHSLAPNDMDQLLGLACPCKLVFDKSREGPVDDPVLLRHPDSPGRSNSIGDERDLPDLRADGMPLRPLPADMTAPGSFHYQMLMDCGPWPENDGHYRLVQHKQNDIYIVTDRKPIPADVRSNAVIKRLGMTGLDGRNRFGFLVCQRIYPDPDKHMESAQYPSSGLVVERTIHAQSGVGYGMHIADSAHKGKCADLLDIYTAVWWIYFIATADIEHMLRRDAESDIQRTIEFNLTAVNDKPSAAEFAEKFLENAGVLADGFKSRSKQSEIMF
jgi:predicted nucleotidyltransferase